MTDKNGRNTTGTRSRKKSARKLSLGKRVDVYSILFNSFDLFVESLFKILRKAPEGNFPAEAVAERFAIEAELLTTIFTGRMTDSTIPVPGWNGGGLGRRLRARFALDLLALKPEDAELYEEDEDIVHFGMLKLVEEMQDLALKILFDKDDSKVEGQSRRLHDCFAKWSELLSNSSEPLPSQC